MSRCLLDLVGVAIYLKANILRQNFRENKRADIFCHLVKTKKAKLFFELLVI